MKYIYRSCFGLGSLFVSLFIVSSVFAYDETTEDVTLRLAIQKKVDSRFHDDTTKSISQAIQKLEAVQTTPKYRDYARLQYHLERALLYSKRMAKTVANSSEQLSPSGFLKKYLSFVSSTLDEQDTQILQSCMDRYDVVDAIAKRENFPTAIILATWRKESSCRVVNPSNGDGLFQIVAHEYPPTTVYQLKNLVWSGVSSPSGELRGQGRLPKDFEIDPSGSIPFVQSGNILEEQVLDFIKFSRAKWKWYDSLQAFDEIPVTLSYSGLDLLSIRKHAILYNGFAKGRHPENSFYANQNFGWDYERKQDGLVVLVLRVLEAIQKVR